MNKCLRYRGLNPIYETIEIRIRNWLFQILTERYFIHFSVHRLDSRIITPPKKTQDWIGDLHRHFRSPRTGQPYLSIRPMTTKHTRKLRGFAAAFTLGILALQARAGDIVGSVFDGSTKGSLPGATVSVVDSNVTTVVDGAGNFRLTGLAAGSYALR